MSPTLYWMNWNATNSLARHRCSRTESRRGQSWSMQRRPSQRAPSQHGSSQRALTGRGHHWSGTGYAPMVTTRGTSSAVPVDGQFIKGAGLSNRRRAPQLTFRQRRDLDAKRHAQARFGSDCNRLSSVTHSPASICAIAASSSSCWSRAAICIRRCRCVRKFYILISSHLISSHLIDFICISACRSALGTVPACLGSSCL